MNSQTWWILIALYFAGGLVLCIWRRRSLMLWQWPIVILMAWPVMLLVGIVWGVVVQIKENREAKKVRRALFAQYGGKLGDE